MDLRAVDIFPALIDDATIGQRPRGVILFEVGGKHLDVVAGGVAAMQGGDLGEPAIHPAFAAAGDEYDISVGQDARFEVIPRTVC